MNDAAVARKIAALCDRFGYPPELRGALERISVALRRLQPRAILVVGSAARGELSFRRAADGRLEMFSDLELFCLLGSESAEDAEDVWREIASVEREIFVPNRLFHIDCLIGRDVPAGASGRGLLWYEGGLTFQVLFGPEDSYFGEVDPSLLSLGLVNQLVIIRLWWLLVSFPSRLLIGPGQRSALSGDERDAFMYTQVRNLLDVLSIWLPNEGVYECGYVPRLRYVQAHWEELRGTEHLPTGFLDDVSDATRRKLECDLEGEPMEWYLKVIRGYEGLVGFLLGVPRAGYGAELAEAIRERWDQRCGARHSWRFRAYAATLTMRQALRRGAGLRWLLRRSRRESAALEFLVEMHRAAGARLFEDAAASRAHLVRARAALWRFGGQTATLAPPGDEAAFAIEWNALRAASVDAFTRYYRKLGPKRAAVEEWMRQDERGVEEWAA